MRQAAVLFVIAGVIGLLNDAIPGGVGYGKVASLLFDSANLAIEIVAGQLPWSRWTPRASLALVPFALANIAGSNIAGVLPQPTYGIWFVLVFVWIGMWHPPKTSLAFGPLAAVAYLVPFAFGAPKPSGAVGSVILAIPVAMLVGETIARNAYATRRAQSAQADAMLALAKASVTDDLTGLGNRRHGDALLASLAADDTLAMLDLDNFKGINDAFGHPKGDRVLQEFGSFLLQSVRDKYAVARFGGEEFIIVLRGAGTPGTDTIERLLSGWRALSPVTTFSAGVAVHQPLQPASSTFGMADAALYQAQTAWAGSGRRSRRQWAKWDDQQSREAAGRLIPPGPNPGNARGRTLLSLRTSRRCTVAGGGLVLEYRVAGKHAFQAPNEARRSALVLKLVTTQKRPTLRRLKGYPELAGTSL